MKKLIIVTAALLVFIGLGYLIYSNLMIQSSPCASIFEQTTVSLEEKINIFKDKGGAILGRGQIQKLSDQSDQITADLKTCCILFHDDKIAFEEFLNCQDDFGQYERNIDRLAHLVAAAQDARQQERYDLVNLRLSHIEGTVKDLAAISDHFQAQMKSLMDHPSKGYKEPAGIAQKSVIAETEPNDSYNQGMEISFGILTGTLSGDDQQDYFRFELNPGNILSLNFTAGEDSQNLKIALRDFEGNELWNSGETSPGANTSTRMMMNNISGGIYYAVVYSGIGPYKLDLFRETQNDAGSGIDAGDRITKALAIKPGNSFFGEMGGFDVEDWYRFDIPPGHILKLSFTPKESSEAMKFSLRSFERSEVWYSGAVPPGETRPERVMMNNSSGGTYYLKAYYGSGPYGFEIFIEGQNDAASGTDAGDQMAEALKIMPGRSYSGQLGGYDENDWYRFDIPAGGILKMALTNYEDGEPMKFSFRNVDGIEVWRSEVVSPGTVNSTRMMINNTTGGIYFLKAFYGNGPYKFEVLLENQNDGDSGTDAGDKITEALKIKPGRSIRGELGGFDKEDWYTFSPPEGKSIEFTSNQDGEPLKLSMGNVARRKVLYTAELTPGITKTFEIPRDVQPPYFLKVYGGSSKYSFEIK
ncbi:MAG: hypothetical protein V3V39_04530 [Desulfobacterales bacterium]